MLRVLLTRDGSSRLIEMGIWSRSTKRVALAAVDARKAQAIELRFFGGLSVAETAEILQGRQQTVMRDWRLAKAWLLRELSGDKS